MIESCAWRLGRWVADTKLRFVSLIVFFAAENSLFILEAFAR